MKFSASKPQLPGFQITPMLDVVFLLLCFFVTTSVYSQWENEVDVQLPTADTGKPTDRLPGEIIINVKGGGEIVVNERTLSPEELASRCAMLAKNFPGQPVVIRADKETRYEDFMKVLDVCRKADVYNISFATAIPSGEPDATEPAPARVR